MLRNPQGHPGIRALRRWFLTALDPGDPTIAADRLATRGEVTAMTPRFRIITTAWVGQRATLTVRTDLNRADAQRLRAHLDYLARTRSRTETGVWPYAGRGAGAGGRASTRAAVTLTGAWDGGGADRLHNHLAALLSIDVGDLRVDLTTLTGADPLLASALGCARNSLSARGGTFTVAGGRRLDYDPAHLAPASELASRRAGGGAQTGHRLVRGRPETADQP